MVERKMILGVVFVVFDGNLYIECSRDNSLEFTDSREWLVSLRRTLKSYRIVIENCEEVVITHNGAIDGFRNYYNWHDFVDCVNDMISKRHVVTAREKIVELCTEILKDLNRKRDELIMMEVFKKPILETCSGVAESPIETDVTILSPTQFEIDLPIAVPAKKAIVDMTAKEIVAEFGDRATEIFNLICGR